MSHSRTIAAIAALVALFSTLLQVPASAGESPTNERLRVAVFGDSLIYESQDQIGFWMSLADIEVQFVTLGGLAPCDFIEVAERVAADFGPDVVIMNFTGNSLSPCMDAAVPLSAQYLDSYRSDAAELTAIFADRGSRVWWTESLPHKTRFNRRVAKALDEIYATTPGISGMIPVEEYFTTKRGRYAKRVPCRFAWERCRRGRVRVRALDGAHLGDGPKNQAGRIRLAAIYTSFIVLTER